MHRLDVMLVPMTQNIARTKGYFPYTTSISIGATKGYIGLIVIGKRCTGSTQCSCQRSGQAPRRKSNSESSQRVWQILLVRTLLTYRSGMQRLGVVHVLRGPIVLKDTNATFNGVQLSFATVADRLCLRTL